MDKTLTLDEILNELHYMALAHISGTHASDDVHVKDAKKALQELVKECIPPKKDERPMEDGVPVETYGYEQEYNSAIEDISKALKEKGLL
jgi:hypothetical protein